MEYYAAIKKNEFISFAGTWIKLETIILSNLTRTENQTPHVLTHKWELNNENIRAQGGEHHTLGFVGEHLGGIVGGRELGGITWGEMPDIGDGGMEAGSKPHYHVCTYATILHVLHMYPRT